MRLASLSKPAGRKPMPKYSDGSVEASHLGRKHGHQNLRRTVDEPEGPKSAKRYLESLS